MATSLRLGKRLLEFKQPIIMGILNATPDSFFEGSRTPVADGSAALVARARQLLDEGAAILDVGAVSTRPGATAPSADEELSRLSVALDALRGALPEAIVSIDTFRPEVARRVVRDYGVDVINDVSGCADPDMAAAVAELGVPYVLTHNPLGLQVNKSASPEEDSDAKPIDVRVAQFFAERLQTLYDLGVADVILDPGFGFGKSMTENYALMAALPRLVRLFPQAPFLIGISRKSMIYRLLDTTPEASLNGTTVLNTVALQAGAHILRVHDVREASEALRITLQLMDSKQPPAWTPSPLPLKGES